MDRRGDISDLENPRNSKFPEAHVIGNDISPIQPQWVPPNVEFVVDDFEREWMYPADNFDFIHSRTIAGYVSKRSCNGQYG